MCYNQSMKRKYFIVAGCIIPMLLTSCPSKTFIGGDLIFSEFYSPNIYSNSAVEIANVGKKELDLSKYHINVYRDPGTTKVKPTEKIYLEGTLAPGETYIIVGIDASEEMKAKANLVTNELINNGDRKSVV